MGTTLIIKGTNPSYNAADTLQLQSQSTIDYSAQRIRAIAIRDTTLMFHNIVVEDIGTSVPTPQTDIWERTPFMDIE